MMQWTIALRDYLWAFSAANGHVFYSTRAYQHWLSSIDKLDGNRILYKDGLSEEANLTEVAQVLEVLKTHIANLSTYGKP